MYGRGAHLVQMTCRPKTLAGQVGGKMTEDWIVVLETTSAGSKKTMSIDTLRRLMESMGERNPTTLYSPDRYALQVVVRAPAPDEALRSALASWQDAQRELQLEGWELARAEVVTQAEFEEDALRWNREINAASDGEREDLDETLLRQAFHDPLTGLANRELFVDHLHHQLLRAERLGVGVSVVFFEVEPAGPSDGFSEPGFADLLASTTADRLVGAAREGDSVGRLSETRYAVLLHEVPEASASAVARRILDVLRQPVTFRARKVPLRVRKSVVTGSGSDAVESLLEQAEIELGGGRPTGGRQGWSTGPSGPGMVGRLVEREAESRAMTMAKEPDTIEEGEPVLNEVFTHLGGSLGHLRVVSAELGRRLVPSQVWNEHLPQQLPDFQVVLESRSAASKGNLSGLVLARRQPVWVSCTEAATELPPADAAVRAGFTAGVGLPVVVDGEAVGVLELFLPESVVPDDSLVDELARMGEEFAHWWRAREASSRGRAS